jgi:hypothetical protein
LAIPKKTSLKRVNVNLEAALHDRFKSTAASRGHKMTEILVEFIERYVRNGGKANGSKTK